MADGDILILCGSRDWDALPLNAPPRQAASLLACWTAAWHPTLVRRFQAIPRLGRASDLPRDSTRKCLLIPEMARSDADPTKIDGLLTGPISRGCTRAEVLATLGLDPVADGAAGFFSLGYCWMQIHLMTKGIRFGDSIDEEEFGLHLRNAAELWHSGGTSRSYQEPLQQCFDLLLEERCRFYPGDANLYRIVLADSLTDASQVAAALETGPATLYLTGATLNNLREREPDAERRIGALLQKHTASIVSPGLREFDDRSAGLGTAIRLIRAGRQTVAAVQGETPLVSGRRHTPPGPWTPELLRAAGFSLGLFHPLEARSPARLSGPQATWKAPGGGELRMLADSPLPVGDATGLLRLGAAIGEQIDSYHYAHVLLVHKPGELSDSFSDLQESCSWGPIIGKFRTLAHAAENVQCQSWGETPESDSLDQWPRFVSRAAGSSEAARVVDYWRLLTACQQIRRAAALFAIAGHRWTGLFHRLDGLRRAIDRLGTVDSSSDESGQRRSESDEIEAAIREATCELAGTGGQSPAAARGSAGTGNDGASQQIGREPVVVNASCQPQVVALFTDGRHRAVLRNAVTPPVIKLCEPASGGQLVVASIPGGALSALPPGGASVGLAAGDPVLVDGNSLRNEHITLDIDPASGAISSLRKTGHRETAASWRLSVRSGGTQAGGERETPAYAAMQATAIRLEPTGRLHGRATVEGVLERGGKRLGVFRWTAELWRGQRWVSLKGEVALEEPLGGGLAGSHVCSRVAWRDPAAERYRYWQAARLRCCRQRFTSPVCTEVGKGPECLSLFHFGHSWHRQSALNILDTVLAEAPGEPRRVFFRAGLGLGVAHPLETAELLMAGPAVASMPGGMTGVGGAARIIGWGASTLHWYDADLLDDNEGGWGVLLHMRETAGTAGNTRIRFAAPPRQAWLVDTGGSPLSGATLEGDSVQIDWSPWQMFSLAATWQA